MIELEMVRDFQCSGCLFGHEPESCSKFSLEQRNEQKLFSDFFTCKNHYPATSMGGVGRIALGLPRGFNRCGNAEFGEKPRYYIRLYAKPEHMHGYDKFNVPVWAMELDGYLYVRCYSPRNNCLFVDVVKDGKLEHAPGAINVGEFYNEID